MKIELMYKVARNVDGLSDYQIQRISETRLSSLFDEKGEAPAALHALSYYFKEFAKNALDKNPQAAEVHLSISVLFENGVCQIEIADDLGSPFSAEFLVEVSPEVRGSLAGGVPVDYSQIVQPGRAYASNKAGREKQLGGAGIGLSCVNSVLVACNGKLQIQNDEEEGAKIRLLSFNDSIDPESFEKIALRANGSYVQSAVSTSFSSVFTGKLDLPRDRAELARRFEAERARQIKEGARFFSGTQDQENKIEPPLKRVCHSHRR